MLYKAKEIGRVYQVFRIYECAEFLVATFYPNAYDHIGNTAKEAAEEYCQYQNKKEKGSNANLLFLL